MSTVDPGSNGVANAPQVFMPIYERTGEGELLTIMVVYRSRAENDGIGDDVVWWACQRCERIGTKVPIWDWRRRTAGMYAHIRWHLRPQEAPA